MHMDNMPLWLCRPGADGRLVSGEMLFTELLAQLLRPVCSQAVVYPRPVVKADDIVVFHIFPFWFFSGGD